MVQKQELVELTKIRKALEKDVKRIRKKAKKIKLSDLLTAESINERVKAFMDKLTLDDAIKGSVFLASVYLIYPFIYKLRPRDFWKNFALKGDLLKSLGWLFTAPIIQKDIQTDFELDIFALSIIVAYLAVYQGENIFTMAKTVVGSLGA